MLTIGVGSGGQSAVLAGVASTALSGARKAPAEVFASTLSAATVGRRRDKSCKPEGRRVGVGIRACGLEGGLTGGLNRVQLGSPATVSISGNYTLNVDCTGSMHFIDAQGFIYNIAFVVIDGGAGLLVLQTDAATVNSGIAISSSLANSSGSVAQIASAGHWTTTITLVNNGPTRRRRF